MSGPTQAQVDQHSARARQLRVADSGMDLSDARLIQMLVQSRRLPAYDGAESLRRSRRLGVPVDALLLAEQQVLPRDVAHARARMVGVPWIDLEHAQVDQRLIRPQDAAFWLQNGCLPVVRKGDLITVACADPTRPPALPQTMVTLRSHAVAADPEQLEQAIKSRHSGALVHRAETLSPAPLSSRRIAPILSRGLIAITGMSLLMLLLTPYMFMAAVLILSLMTVAGNALLRAIAIGAYHPDHTPEDSGGVHHLYRLPNISILLPVFREGPMLGPLMDSIAALDYPRARMDVILLIEEGDTETRTAAKAMNLPPWVRVLIVPKGRVQTKPRAMNYALPFCKGSIIGIYDAEDRPAADQLRRIADRFAFADDKLACIQGVLGFYNTHRNWISRAFAIEYASWFRVVLPGIAALGVPVPLGGTTVFATRDALELAGGWDAHNVTEDADLGIRFARMGLRTELMSTLTEEEANYRPYPWIKQRSRWLKGYAMTWAAHMQTPVRLFKELGPLAFLGFNAIFLGTLAAFAGAPLFWSLWIVSLGIPHPALVLLPDWIGYAVIGVFVTSQAVQVIVTTLSLWRAGLLRLIPWVPMLTFYWPLATVACYKALVELVTRPFYWDKTAHGIDGMTCPHAPPPTKPT